MSTIKFVKTHPDAIIPKVKNKCYYELHTIGCDVKEIINGVKIYYLRTGLKVIQPKTRVSYLHPFFFNYEREYTGVGISFQNKITTIYPNDQSEIIIPVKMNPNQTEIDTDQLFKYPIARLISRKKNECVYVKMKTFKGYGGTKHDFLQLNGNEKEMNYLINILVPIIYAESRKDGSYTFEDLDKNFTNDEVLAIKKVTRVGIHNGILKHILLEGDTPREKAETFAEHYNYGTNPPIGKFFKKKESDSDVFDPNIPPESDSDDSDSDESDSYSDSDDSDS